MSIDLVFHLPRMCHCPEAHGSLYTQSLSGCMSKGRANKALELTPAKVKYIIREKTNNISFKIIAAEMKVSIRTVSRVLSYWMENKSRGRRRNLGVPRRVLANQISSYPKNPQRAKIPKQGASRRSSSKNVASTYRITQYIREWLG